MVNKTQQEIIDKKKQSSFVVGSFSEFLRIGGLREGFLIAGVLYLIAIIICADIVYDYKKQSDQVQMHILKTEISNFDISEKDKNERLTGLVELSIYDKDSLLKLNSDLEMARINKIVQILQEQASIECVLA